MMSSPISFEQLFHSFVILRRRFQSLPIMAIPWLYCTNTRDAVHCKLLQGGRSPALWVVFLRMGWILLRSCQWFAIFSYFHWKFRQELKQLRSFSFDGIAKTWVYPKREEADGQDFYYGSLQAKLREKKFRLFMLCGNPMEKNWALFASKLAQKSKQDRLPDFCLISPFRVFQMAFLQIGSSLQLLWSALFEKEAWMRRLLRQAVCDSLRSQTLLNGIHFWMGKKAARLWKPKAFLTLYEGFAWEKCLWKGVRAAAPFCKIVGYQHTVILNRTLELRRPAHSQNNGLPDIVLCAGRRTLEMMKPGHEKANVALLPFGSFRFPAGGILLNEPKPSLTRVLVLPEGTLSEALILFKAAAATARRLKDFSFILRLHPLLSVEKVKPFLGIDLKGLDNVSFSGNKKIEDDFAACSALLYRASSASLYGVLNGLKPYYWRQGDEENIDPLFELQTFREEVVSTADFAEKLKGYEKASRETIFSAWQVATKYVKGYTIPVAEQSIQNLMESIQ